MTKPKTKAVNDFSRCLDPLDMDATVIAVIEMSQSSWLVAGIIPGVERQPLAGKPVLSGSSCCWFQAERLMARSAMRSRLGRHGCRTHNRLVAGSSPTSPTTQSYMKPRSCGCRNSL